jgi:O-acetylhomoserine/O-acetylserine sulfhydrylase-like pyridoxal-dependent enzyme
MIRVSVGIETLEDILWDLDQSLHAAAKERG